MPEFVLFRSPSATSVGPPIIPSVVYTLTSSVLMQALRARPLLVRTVSGQCLVFQLAPLPQRNDSGIAANIAAFPTLPPPRVSAPEPAPASAAPGTASTLLSREPRLGLLTQVTPPSAGPLGPAPGPAAPQVSAPVSDEESGSQATSIHALIQHLIAMVEDMRTNMDDRLCRLQEAR